MGGKNSSPFMGKYPPKAGDGAPITLPHSWGSTRRRRGKGRKKLFPIHGEVPAEGGGWGPNNSSPFMGKYPPKAGDGAPKTLPHSWGSTRPQGSPRSRRLRGVKGGGWGRSAQWCRCSASASTPSPLIGLPLPSDAPAPAS